MRPHWQSKLGWFAFGIFLVLEGTTLSASRSGVGAEEFTPVASAAAIHTALTANQKLLADWLNQQDYASAADSVQGLLVLTQLYSCQSGEPAWRDRTAVLRESLNQVARAAKEKNAEACRKGLRECEAVLAKLAKSPPRGAREAIKDFQPAGPTRSWMLLFDGIYTDARSARNAKELKDLAFTLAEGANALTYQRADARWRQAAREVRESALAAASKAHAGELEPARQALKGVYQRCEACHQGYKR